MNEIQKQQKWKEYPHAHSMHAPEDGNNLVQTRLGGEFWATDVIMHKAYLRKACNIILMMTLPRRTAIGSQSGIDQSLHKPLLKR